jgi:O-acetyl-ADP-ribose deacetylase (regulator of RNase III)
MEGQQQDTLGAGNVTPSQGTSASTSPTPSEQQEGLKSATGQTSSSSALPSPEFKLILVDLQEDLVEALRKAFAGLPNVEFHVGRFERLREFDCMVSAANSFGLMDGGVDAAITRYFGNSLMRRVQQHVIEAFDGEQPVGTSFIIATNNKKHPWLAHTPTMRVPMSIEGTDNVYLAMKAMLRAVKGHNAAATQEAHKIKSVACTGLGTFYGKMTFVEAARQMALAYKNFLSPPKTIDWTYASLRQYEVGYGGFEGFQRAVALKEARAEEWAQTKRARANIAGTMALLASGDARYDTDDQDKAEVEAEDY